MHSFGHTFAHSSQPMHLYQWIECCPRNALGSSSRSYGYSTVTGLRLNVATRACFSVTHSGLKNPRKNPTRPPLPADIGSPDLRDFVGVLAPLHVEDLALPRAHEPAFLRPHPPGLLRLDLLAELEEAVDKRLRPHGATWDEDVRGDERVCALHDAVRIVVRTATDRALPHRDDPLRVRHLLVEASYRGPELQGDRPVQEEHVTLPRARPVDHAEPLCIVSRVARRRHLDRAAHDAEVERPHRVPLRPVEEVPDEGVEDLPDRPLLEGRVDVAVYPLHEILRLPAEDVRLFSRLHHGGPAAIRRPGVCTPGRTSAEDRCATSAFPCETRTPISTILKGRRTIKVWLSALAVRCPVA